MTVAALAQTPAPDDGRLSEYRLKYAIALPTGCRHDEGPGTLEAICATDLDPELEKRSQRARLARCCSKSMPSNVAGRGQALHRLRKFRAQ